MTFHTLPANWQWVTLGDIFHIERGGSPRPIQDYLTNDGSGISWIKIGDVKKGEKYITSTQQKIKVEGLKKSRKIHIDDLLLTNSMSYGIPFISKIEGAIHDGWIVLKPKIPISKEYVFYFLSSKIAYQYFDTKASGSTVKNLQINYVKNTPTPLPPLEIQKQIVEVLESKLEKIQEIKALLESSLKDCETYRASLLESAFRGELTPHSTDWQWVKLGEICDVIKGITYHKDSASTQPLEDYVPIIRATNIQNNQLLFSDFVYIPKTLIQKPQFLNQNDILIVLSSGSKNLVGKTAQITTKWNGSCGAFVGILRIKSIEHSNLVPSFLNFFTQSNLYRKNIISKAQGTSINNLKHSNILSLQIPLPPLEIQKQIVEVLESKLEKIQEIKALLESSLKDCETYRASLLESAFRGELLC